MEKIKTLSIDLETFSDVDLAKCGVYRYVESPAFEILLFGVSVNGSDVVVYDLVQGEKIPAEILAALTDNSIIKWAFNAAFERVCLSMYLGLPSGEYLDPTSWRCSWAWAPSACASCLQRRERTRRASYSSTKSTPSERSAAKA